RVAANNVSHANGNKAYGDGAHHRLRDSSMNAFPSQTNLPCVGSSRRSSLRVIGPAVLVAFLCSSVSAAGADTELRIKRIENGLLPAVLVEGENIKLPGLSERMQAVHVPGVSIAVIHHGKLQWARGFGVMRIGGPAVTPETLFQAASISKVVSTLGILH